MFYFYSYKPLLYNIENNKVGFLLVLYLAYMLTRDLTFQLQTQKKEKDL